MTLVVTASIPLMVIAGGIQASVMTGFSSQVRLKGALISKVKKCRQERSATMLAGHSGLRMVEEWPRPGSVPSGST